MAPPPPARSRHSVSFRRAPLATPASFIPIAHSISIPTAPSTPQPPFPLALWWALRAPGSPAGIRHSGARKLYAAPSAPGLPAPHCPSVSSIGLSIPNVGWRGTNGRRAQLEMEVEEGGQPCPMTKSNFDPHAPKPTLHLGMPAYVLDDCARVVNKFGPIICRHLIGSIWRKVFRLN